MIYRSNGPKVNLSVNKGSRYFCKPAEFNPTLKSKMVNAPLMVGRIPRKFNMPDLVLFVCPSRRYTGRCCGFECVGLGARTSSRSGR